MPIGAARTAQLSNFWNQGPNYFNTNTFALNMNISKSFAAFPAYTFQCSNTDNAYYTNIDYAWTAGTVDTTNKSSWNQHRWMDQWTWRIPNQWFTTKFASAASYTLWEHSWTFNTSSSYTVIVKLGKDSGGNYYWNYDESGIFLADQIIYKYGTTTPITASDLQDRWITVVGSRMARTDFASYTGSGTDTYGYRIMIADCITGEIIAKTDFESFNEVDTLPDINNYSTIYSGKQSPGADPSWRYDAIGGAVSWTGTSNWDIAGPWTVWGAAYDPLDSILWIGNGQALTQSSVTPWIYIDGRTAPISSGGSGDTTVDNATGALVSQGDGKVMTAGRSGGQYAFSNTVYPGS